jgi:predicted secreted protein
MSIVGGIVIFVVIWLLVLFMVLPWGVRTQEESDEDVEPGTVESAPVNPRIWTKFAVTTAITICLFVIIISIVEFELIDLRAYFQDA